MTLGVAVVAGVTALPAPGAANAIAWAEPPSSTTLPPPPIPPTPITAVAARPAGRPQARVQLAAGGPFVAGVVVGSTRPGDVGRAVIGVPAALTLPVGAKFSAGQSLWTVFRRGSVTPAEAAALLDAAPLVPTVLLYDATAGAAVVTWIEGR